MNLEGFIMEFVGAVLPFCALIYLLRNHKTNLGSPPRRIVLILLGTLIIIHLFAVFEHAGIFKLTRVVDLLRMATPILWLLLFDTWIKQQTRNKLADSEKRYRTIVEDQTEFIVRCQPDGTRTFVNEAYARYYGSTPEQLVGTSFFTVLPDEDRKQVKAKYARLSPEHDVETDEHRTIDPDGRIRWHSWTDRGLFDEHGCLIEIQAIGRDITDRKLAEDALRDSERRLMMALQGAQLGVWDWHIPSGSLILDQRSSEMLGYGNRDIKPHISAWDAMVHPDDKARIAVDLKHHLEGLNPYYETEYRVRTKQGHWKWILDLGGVVERGSVGNAVRAVGMHMDIDDRKRAAAEIEGWKTRYEAALQASQQIIYDWNTKSGDILIAGAIVSVLGCAPSAIERFQGWSDRLHPDDLPVFIASSRKVLSSREPFVLEYRMRHEDGHYVELEDHGYFYHSPQDDNSHLVGFLSDVSERKNAERQRVKLEEEFAQKQKMEAVGQLASGIAHDFGNLLTAIQGHLALAFRGLQESHPARRSLQMVEQAAKQGVEMTRGLNAFVHNLPAAKGPCNLNELATESLRMFRHLLPPEIEMALELPETAIWVMGSRSQLQQVAMNLILNARDAMPKGGKLILGVRSLPAASTNEWPPISTSLGTQSVSEQSVETEALPITDRRGVFTLTDSGIGMSEQVMRHVLEPFFTTKDRSQGTGLGMTMVHRVVTDLSGSIHVASVPNEGTRIDIVLPLCAPPPQPKTSQLSLQLQPPRIRPRHLLLLHEENYVGEIVITALESWGYVVILTSSPDKMIARALSHEEDFAALIVDCDILPEPKGESPAFFEFQKLLPGNVPLIAITANGAQFMDETEASPFYILHRPFQMAKLIELVDQATGITSSGTS